MHKDYLYIELTFVIIKWQCNIYVAVIWLCLLSTNLGVIIRRRETSQLHLQSKQVIRSRNNALWFRCFHMFFFCCKSCLLSVLCYVSFHCKMLSDYITYYYHMNRMMRWFERNRRKCVGGQSVDGVDLGDLFL